MIFDVHHYKCRYGTVAAQVRLYEKMGKAAHQRHLGKPVVFGIGETGNVDSYTHVMLFENAAERESSRAALAADPDWQAYLAACHQAGNILSRENHTLRAVSFFGE